MITLHLHTISVIQLVHNMYIYDGTVQPHLHQEYGQMSQVNVALKQTNNCNHKLN